jgi:hypothetical protein
MECEQYVDQSEVFNYVICNSFIGNSMRKEKNIA